MTTIGPSCQVRGEIRSAEDLGRIIRDHRVTQVIDLSSLDTIDCTAACDDLGAWWTEVLKQRLEMYRSLEDATVAKFGAGHFRAWDETYAFFVGLFAAGRLGGGRFVARRAP